MKPAAARSSLLAIALVLSLALASRDVEEEQGMRRWEQGRERREGGNEGQSSGGGWPYHFSEESFHTWTRTRHCHFRVLERFDHELLPGSVGDYRVAYLAAAPRAFLQPSHYDADEIFYVKEGEGVLVLLRKGRRESFCVREGDVMVIPAGSIVYSANTHGSRWLRVVMLLSPVSTPGRFEEFFPVGGEGPESFFSDEVVQAAFNARRDEVEKVFERRSQGEIWQASEEQLRELSSSCPGEGRGGGGGGSGSSEEEIKPISLPAQRPRYSNNHGRIHMITGNESRHLRDLDMEVGMANITRGSMVAPRYTSRATKIIVVVEGSGYFEMACPHKPGSGREEEGEEGHKRSRGYKQVRAQIKEGSVIVLPAGHPASFVAGNEGNLASVIFGVHSNHDEEVFLAGGSSLLKQMDEPGKALVFGAQGREAADRVIGTQTESVFLRGPQQQQRHGGGVSDI